MIFYLAELRKYLSEAGLVREPSDHNEAKKDYPVMFIQPEGGAPHPADVREDDKSNTSLTVSAMFNAGLPYGRADYDWLYQREAIDFWIRADGETAAADAEKFYREFLETLRPEGCPPYGIQLENAYINSFRVFRNLQYFQDRDNRGTVYLFSIMFVIDPKEIGVRE